MKSKLIGLTVALAMVFAPAASFAELPQTEEDIRDAALMVTGFSAPQIIATLDVTVSHMMPEVGFMGLVAWGMYKGITTQYKTAPEKFDMARWRGQASGKTGEYQKWAEPGAYGTNPFWRVMKRYPKDEAQPGVVKANDTAVFPHQTRSFTVNGQSGPVVNWVTRSGPNQG